MVRATGVQVSRHRVKAIAAVVTLLCATALGEQVVVRASTVVVRSVRIESTQKATSKTIRVRWVAEWGSKQPDDVTVTAYSAHRTGDWVVVSDIGPFQEANGSNNEAKLSSPGVHDFTFAQLDRDHPQAIFVGAAGYYTGEVFVDSGDIEVEVILRHKF